MIPWRHSLTVDLTPDQVLDRLEEMTDPDPDSVWQSIRAVAPCLTSKYEPPRFLGRIDRQRGSFYLHSLIVSGGRFQTVFSGTVGPMTNGLRISMWTCSSVGGILTTLAVASFGVRLIWDLQGPDDPQGTSTFVILVLMSLYWIATSIVVHSMAVKAFKSALSGVHQAEVLDPWPLRSVENSEMASDQIPPKAKVPFKAPVVEHFLALADEILRLSTTPPHSIKVEPDGESLTLRFPRQTSDGYDVRADVDNRKGVTVWAGNLAHVPPGGVRNPRSECQMAFGLIYDFLSSANRLHERQVNGETYFAGIEVNGPKGWDEVFSNRRKGKKPDGPASEQYFTNNQVPPRA
jgi:hypothetical protein